MKYLGNSFLGSKTLLRLPKSGLLAYYRDGVDTIGLSVSDYANVDPLYQSIFFIDESTLRPIADAYDLALASPLLNTTTMIGNSSKGVALYDKDTSSDILTKAYRYFRKTYGILAYGSISAGLQKISYGSGINFSDFGAGVPLANYPGGKVVISDGSKLLIFYVPQSGAAGTGETYSANLLSNADFAVDEPPGTDWYRDSEWTVSGGVGVASAATSGKRIVQSIPFVNGELFYTSWELVTVTSDAFGFQVDGNNVSGGITTPGTYVAYYTATRDVDAPFGVGARWGTSNGTIDNLVAKQITTPSTSGIWTSSTTDGAAGSGYLSIETGFNPNLITGSYTYTVYPGN